jgi:hypothetical protein
MNSEYIYLVIILIILITLFFCINFYLKKNIEGYGIYCGRYNIDKSSDIRRCKADNQCKWNEYKSRTGIPAGWCGQNPDGSYKAGSSEEM